MVEKVRMFKEWIERNPLRVWRKERGVTFMELSSILEVNTVSIQQWENGSVTPRPANLEKLTRLDPSLAKKWDVWLSEKPVL